MSIEPPEDAHDPAQRGPERCDDDDGNDGSPDGRPDTDDELVVVVCPNRIYEQLRPELDDWREERCREHEREYEELLAERAQLADEVEVLERRLRRKESQLDAVVTRNEQILEARTESYRRRIEEHKKVEEREKVAEDDVQWTGRKQETGLLARLRNWLR